MTFSVFGSWRLWNVATGECVRALSDAPMTLDVSCSLDGETMLTGSSLGTARLHGMRNAVGEMPATNGTWW